jgi:hypothetical protein
VAIGTPSLLLLSAVAIGMSSLAVASSAVAADGGKPLTTTMSGAEEVPGPGDPDGSGTASLRIKASKGQVCYALEVHDIAPAIAAHVHHAAAGVAGSVAIPLTAPIEGTSSGCADADPALARDITRHPDQYDVNVHTADVPAGAVRGQLG